jgi:poly(hydroxyalkanoate) granule-associated protein
VAFDGGSRFRPTTEEEFIMISKVKAKVATYPAAENVLKSGHQIWLAGLGAFAAAQAEGAKVFKELVKEGAVVESKGIKLANDQIEKTITKASETFAKARGGFQTRLAQPVTTRVNSGLAKFGLPARNDILELSRRVEELSAQVRALS